MSNDNQINRRQILTWAAMASSALAAAACSNGTTPGTDAGLDTNPMDTNAPPDVNRTETMANPDVVALNALLAAEYGAVKAYAAGAGIIGNAPATDPLFTAKDLITQIAVHYQSQHTDHATQLAAQITLLGGTPINMDTVQVSLPASFNIATAGIVDVVKLAADKERQAAIAYNQTIGALSSKDNRFLAGTIQGDETQHFVTLFVILEGVAAFANGLPATHTADQVNQFVPRSFVAAVMTMTTGSLEDPALAFTYTA